MHFEKCLKIGVKKVASVSEKEANFHKDKNLASKESLAKLQAISLQLLFDTISELGILCSKEANSLITTKITSHFK